jgi:hypothetical protein
MKRRLMLSVLAVPLGGCAAAATTSDAGDRVSAVRETDCMRTSLITDWEALDDRHLIVYEGRRPYRVELTQACFGVDFANMIAFFDRSGDERICGFGRDRVIVDQTIPDSCGIAAVDELSVEQADDLKRRAEENEARARPRSRR